MRLPQPQFITSLFLILLSLIFFSCDQNITSTKDQPLVDYVLIVTDSTSNQPLDSLQIFVTTINGDTSFYRTPSPDGRIPLATVASSRTLFELKRSGYNTRDTIDTVNAKPDTVFHRPLARILKIKMTKIGFISSARPQFNLLLRDPNLTKPTGGTVTFEDSLGNQKTIVDTTASGTLSLTALKIGKTVLKVTAPHYLGRQLEVTLGNLSDTARIPSTTVTLIPLGTNQISGQVFYTAATGAKPLLGAKVIFLLKDTLALPDTFITYTSSKPEDFGRFLLDSVPAQDGQLLFFKNKTSFEAIKSIPIIREDVLKAGPLPPLTLTLVTDSSQPFLITQPRDSVQSTDSLVFAFNQPVQITDRLSVSLVNQNELLVDTSWNKTKTLLKVWQKDAPWLRAKTYAYALTLRNSLGQYFTAQGDTQFVLKGIFTIRDTSAISSNVILPHNFTFTTFNSSGYYLFSETDSASSPKPDSSSQFARLKWSWNGNTGHKADSLSLYYKDGGITADNWTLWSTVPGNLDSATLNFADHYSTSISVNQKPALPFKTSTGQIYFRVIPKSGGISYADTTLDALQQGMGPSLYSSFVNPTRSLRTGPDAKDTLKVVFLKVQSDPTNPFDFGLNPPIPDVYFNDEKNSKILTWSWIDSKTGILVYNLPNSLSSASRIRVDLSAQSLNGKPIWHKNRKNEFVLP